MKRDEVSNMKLVRWLPVIFLLYFLSGCDSIDHTGTVSQTMDGIEMQLSLDKQQYALGEEVVPRITITNHNDTPVEFYVPIPDDVREGIAGAMVVLDNQPLWQLITPKNDADMPNIVGRSHYDFVLVRMAANETIEQAYIWDQTLLDQESFNPESVPFETVQAKAGKYNLSAFLLLDELDGEEVHLEIDKQLIVRIDFSIR